MLANQAKLLASLLYGSLFLGALALSSSCTKNDASPGATDKRASEFPELAAETKPKTKAEGEPVPEEPREPGKPIEPVPGADLEALKAADLKAPLVSRFDGLLDSLPSPCQKPHALRTSRNQDESCKRASHAVTYVYELVKDGATDLEVKELYARRFGEPAERPVFALSNEVPHTGPVDAPVKLVEFYDYGCPACARMKQLLELVLKDYDGEVVLFYKQFPLDSHPHSAGAAQAALVAHGQGKFTEMHDLLFANQDKHKVNELKGYGKSIGLKMSKWDTDYIRVSPTVMSDKNEGDKANVQGTPVLFINGIEYAGPSHPKYLKLWIDEHVAQAI